jgi:pimeloyl-ACP methyl ester carboxylesterase
MRRYLSLWLSSFLLCMSCARNEPAPSAPPVLMNGGAGIVSGPAGRLRVYDGGKGGVPVLFVHSFAGDSTHWEKQLAHLRLSRRAVALELRAHGLSDPSADGAYEVDNFADDISAVADALGLEKFYLVGHSLGGAAALVYASRHPEKVAGLLLAGAPGKVPDEQAAKIIRSLESGSYQKVMDDYWAQLSRNAGPFTIEKLNVGRAKMARASSISIIKGVFHYDPVTGLERYRGPKLSVISPRENTPYALHHLVRGLPVTIVKGTSHWIQLDKPEAFNRILDEFIGPVL